MVKTLTLTQPAKDYAKHVLLNFHSRDDMVTMLESVGCACYDDEPDDDLADAIIDSIEANDIHFDFSWGVALARGGEAKMLWLDMGEVWQ